MSQNLAKAIVAVHTERDRFIADHVIKTIDEKLNDTDWLLTGDNYTRHDNELRYRFKLIDIFRELVTPTERQWLSTHCCNHILDHYEDNGFVVNINSQDEMTLLMYLDDSISDDGTSGGVTA